MTIPNIRSLDLGRYGFDTHIFFWVSKVRFHLYIFPNLIEGIETSTGHWKIRMPAIGHPHNKEGTGALWASMNPSFHCKFTRTQYIQFKVLRGLKKNMISPRVSFKAELVGIEIFAFKHVVGFGSIFSTVSARFMISAELIYHFTWYFE